jgi:hypothetical protein
MQVGGFDHHRSPREGSTFKLSCALISVEDRASALAVHREVQIMSTLSQVYQNAIRSVHGTYLGTWLPSLRLKLGDVGIIRNGEFQPQTSLNRLNISFGSVQNSGKFGMDINSKQSTSITVKAVGAPPIQGSSLGQFEAGIFIEFKEAEAVLVQARDCVSHIVDDLISLEGSIQKCASWQRNWVVITGIVNSKASTTLISNSANAGIDIATKSNAPVGQPDLCDSSLGFSVRRQRGLGCQNIAEQSPTPLYRAAKLKRNWLFRKHLKQTYQHATHLGFELPVFACTAGWSGWNSELINQLAALATNDDSILYELQKSLPQYALQEIDDLDIFLPEELNDDE